MTGGLKTKALEMVIDGPLRNSGLNFGGCQSGVHSCQEQGGKRMKVKGYSRQAVALCKAY